MTVQPIFEVPWERHGILVPGLPILPEGVERHPVPGGGSRALEVYRGDEILLLDREGMQPAEMVLFSPDGSARAAHLGVARGDGRPEGIIATLRGLTAGQAGKQTGGGRPAGEGTRSGARVLRALEKAGFDLGRAEAVRAFGPQSRPGDMARFVAETDGLLLVAAPGGPMAPMNHDAPTEIILYLRRARLPEGKPDIGPPDPLADPVLDINIQPGNAVAYEVRAGQFIQVLDVKGRECSDFQAFALRDLDRGLEREIDPTTTRALSGSLYPAPGIHSKFWNVDQQPLVEIVQDTCGRHDTFGLACTARYYEDLGYPGHVNCSDNINRQLARWQVRPRAGWPAINFFFNTLLDATNAIGMADPWSRPGDYVLLRALTDLVCVSSACPCDVDPANGWNPTDIQVRTYRADEDFRPSIGWRKTPEADLEETRKTAFHDCFARHTRDFVPYNGYWLAHSFANWGPVAEYWACRERVAVMDLSPLRKYEVLGPDAEQLLQLCCTRDIRRLSQGQVVYTAMCYEHGGMIDDGTVYRLGDSNFRWIGGTDKSGLWLKEQAQRRGLNVWVRPSTDQVHNIAVQGRHSRAILERIFWTPPTQPSLADLGWFRLAVARIGGVTGTAVVISRTGYSGELGYEIFCHPKDAVEVFDKVWEAGQEFGIAPLGLAALDMLRIEAGLIFAGSEFDDSTDPFEAGIGFAVALKTKTEDFIGRAALEERKAHPQRKLVGLEVEGGEVPSAGDPVLVGRARVGEVTSATRSPILGKVIALARVATAHSAEGTAIMIGRLDGEQKQLRARVVRFPHFDPTKERARGNYG